MIGGARKCKQIWQAIRKADFRKEGILNETNIRLVFDSCRVQVSTLIIPNYIFISLDLRRFENSNPSRVPVSLRPGRRRAAQRGRANPGLLSDQRKDADFSRRALLRPRVLDLQRPDARSQALGGRHQSVLERAKSQYLRHATQRVRGHWRREAT